MSDPIKDGGPAFPQHDLSGYGMGPNECEGKFFVSGMSLRDWFAGQALSGVFACPKVNVSIQETANANQSSLSDQIAKDICRLADAMLKAREEAHDAPQLSRRGDQPGCRVCLLHCRVCLAL